MALRDGRPKAALAGLVGQCTRRPVAAGACRCRRWLTGQRDALAPWLGAQGQRGTRSRGVLSAFRDGAAGAWEPVTAPAPDRGTRGAAAAGDVGCRQALRQQEDPLG